MMSSPLVDSVGAALTTVQVNGEVKSSFKLNVPFDSDEEVRAWGYADLTNTKVAIKTPEMNLDKVSGRIKFDNDVVRAAGLTGRLLEQPVALDFRGENAEQGYDVNIDVVGDWELKPLASYLGKRWIDPVDGHVPWQMGIAIQLDDVGFAYQIDANADLKMVSSDYPYPLKKELNQTWKARMQASGTKKVSALVYNYQTLNTKPKSIFVQTPLCSKPRIWSLVKVALKSARFLVIKRRFA